MPMLIKVYAFIKKNVRRGQSPATSFQGETEEIGKDIYNDPVELKKVKQKLIDDFFNTFKGKPKQLKKFIKFNTSKRYKTETWSIGTVKVKRNIKGQFITWKKT